MRKQVFVILLVLTIGALLAGCGGATATEGASTDEVPVVSREADDKIVAEAVIEPARSSELRFDLTGTVIEVLVQESDAVSEGDLLAQMETGDLERAVTQAELDLRQAQLRLERLEEPADEVDVEIAQAAVSDAEAAYAEARTNLTVTEHSVSVGDEVRAARAARDQTYRIYQSIQAKKNEGQEYDEDRLRMAHDAYLDALGAYNRAVESAELQLTVARNEATRAYHALEQAQNDLDRLLEGADEADIEAAQLDIEAAELTLEEARSNLEEATLLAPFSGVVTEIYVETGETAAAGEAVLALATLDELQARTTDLTELDVARVAEGQSATVTVDALPEKAFAGRVREIGLQPGDYRGDVVYAVTIELIGADDASLRWGMTALVEIETD